MILHPVSQEIAQLAGKIEVEQAAQGGFTIAFEDLVIGFVIDGEEFMPIAYPITSDQS